ncbi:MAG: ATP-dependent DNA ligase [Pseudomonadota bacterium]
MKRFARLFAALDGTTRTSEKTAALTAYFRDAPDADKLWTIALLSGRRPKRAVNATELRTWAAEAAGVPLWLFEDAYSMVGDLAETIALILPVATGSATRSLSETIAALTALTGRTAPDRRAAILAEWQALGADERMLFNKLITGGFRMGVSQGLMTRALAAATGVPETTLAHRLMGEWTPHTTSFADLTGDVGDDLGSRPYPFALASPLEQPPDTLGPPSDWIAEWKWDGIRGQLIHRPGTFALWSRGEELITDRFPEFAVLADFLPQGTVIDGEVLAWGEGVPLPFAALQRRIGRKSVPKKLLAEAPARLLAYDLLESAGSDFRTAPLSQRRAELQALLVALPPGLPIALSAQVPIPDWDSLAQTRSTSRNAMAEGLMLKRAASAYHVGRKRGDWWKWKVDPFTIDAVMIYAQAGHGRRATLYTDFTFAVRDGDALVPFTKAYSGLTDAEFAEITRWVQKNTLERFGPVRRVPPELVFEIAFEGIQASPRHKSGIALRFPRMLRWRRDKPSTEIDTLDNLRAMLAAHG